MTVTSIKAIEAQAKVVAAFIGGDALKQTSELLKLIEENYLEELVNVTPENLTALQAQILQIRAMQKLLATGSGTGRI